VEGKDVWEDGKRMYCRESELQAQQWLGNLCQ
jgi:hypothetical protein